MIQQIAEELAAERGHLEVNVDLFDKVEALGDRPEPSVASLPWTEGAQKRLQEKIRNSPPIAIDFVTDMLKRDTEDLAREKGLTHIDEAALVQLWDAPQERVLWSDEAWKRLHTSPDFVRSGIRKAAGATSAQAWIGGNRFGASHQVSQRSDDEGREADTLFRL